MKAFFAIVLAVITVGAISWFSFFAPVSVETGILNVYGGAVTLTHAGKAVAGNTGASVYVSDIIKTASESRASIIFKSGTVIRLDGGTEAEVAKGGMKLRSGHIWSTTKEVGWTVETPTITAAVRGTSFDVFYQSLLNGVLVNRGTVWANINSNPKSAKKVQAGNIFTISDAAASADFEKGPRPATDADRGDWTAFNEGEDARRAGESTGGAPPAISSTNPPASTAVQNTILPPPPVTDKIKIPLSPAPSTVEGQLLSPSPQPMEQKPGDVSDGTVAAERKLVRITLLPEKSAIRQNEILHLYLTGFYSNGTEAVINAGMEWIQNPHLGIIDTSSNFHASFTGETVIAASIQGLSSNPSYIRVDQELKTRGEPLARSLARLALACEKIYGSASVAYQDNLPRAQCKVTAFWNDGASEDATPQVSWGVFGTAKGYIDQSGLYAPSSPGTDNITATYQGQSASVLINIP